MRIMAGTKIGPAFLKELRKIFISLFKLGISFMRKRSFKVLIAKKYPAT